MLRFLVRAVGFVALAWAFAAAVMDGARSIANSTVLLTPLGATIARLAPERFLAIAGAGGANPSQALGPGVDPHPLRPHIRCARGRRTWCSPRSRRRCGGGNKDAACREEAAEGGANVQLFHQEDANGRRRDRAARPQQGDPDRREPLRERQSAEGPVSRGQRDARSSARLLLGRGAQVLGSRARASTSPPSATPAASRPTRPTRRPARA